MAEPTLTLAVECRFRRPAGVVRAHFLDMRHHIAHGVHHGVRYEILAEEPRRHQIRQRFKVLGLTKVDEFWLSYRDGAIVQEFTRGDFAGGTLTLELTPDGDATRAVAHFAFPLRGINRLLAPILRRTILRLAHQALEEDRVDLEDRRYEPSGWAAAQVAAA